MVLRSLGGGFFFHYNSTGGGKKLIRVQNVGTLIEKNAETGTPTRPPVYARAAYLRRKPLCDREVSHINIQKCHSPTFDCFFGPGGGGEGPLRDTTTSVTSCSDPNRHARRRIRVVYLGEPYSPVTDVDFFYFQLHFTVDSQSKNRNAR